METIIKSYKYRIYPSLKQISLIKNQFHLLNNLYNACIEQRISNYKHIHSKFTSKYDQLNELKDLKQSFPEYKTIHSQILQNVIDRVDKAFKKFFLGIKNRKKIGFPRFKPYKEYKSFTLPQSGYSFVNKVNNKNKLINKLKISKLGEFRIKLHRKIEGKIKSCTIKKTKTDKWFVIFSCECIPKRLPITEEVIGIDLNIKNCATLSNGEVIKNPKFLKQEAKELVKAQQKLSKTEKKSKEREYRRKVVARVHERISNKRENFHQQNSRKIVNHYQLICYEKLNINSMIESNNEKVIGNEFNKAILDISWGTLIKYTEDKAEEAGRSIEKVNPKNTTRMCSKCKNIIFESIPLDVRVYRCERVECGYVGDRDKNAALNILSLGLQAHNKKLNCKDLASC